MWICCHKTSQDEEIKAIMRDKKVIPEESPKLVAIKAQEAKIFKDDQWVSIPGSILQGKKLKRYDEIKEDKGKDE